MVFILIVIFIMIFIVVLVLVCLTVLPLANQELPTNCKTKNPFLNAQTLQNAVKLVKRDVNLREAPKNGKNATCPYMHETHSSPFIAVILKRTSGQFLCMGSILDDKSILSAKNCFEGEKNDNDYYVLAGYLKSHWGRHSQVKKVDAMIKKEDLVILKLKHPLKFSKTVKKIKLPLSKNFTAILPSRDEGCEVGIYGFPVNKWDMPGDALSKSSIYSLKGAKVVATADCETFYKDKGMKNASDDFSCLKGETNFCWGVMGSPVVASHKNGIMQLGVIVMANCDGTKDYPMLNVHLAHQLQWVKSNSDHAG